MSETRIPISEPLRDELRAAKRGDETYTDVIRRAGFGGDTADPIVHMSDGPALVLEDGNTVRLLVRIGGERAVFTGYSQGASVFRPDADGDPAAEVAVVDAEPEAEPHIAAARATGNERTQAAGAADE